MEKPYFELMPGGWYCASNAIVADAVTLGKDSSLWFGVVARGDMAPIVVGERTNVQDIACLHVDPGIVMTIGNDVSIAHHATVHCRSVGDACLIGMHAVLLGGAVIGEGCVIAAGAIIKENAVIPPRSLVVGVPGRIARDVTDAEYAANLYRATHYVETARSWYLRGTGIAAT